MSKFTGKVAQVIGPVVDVKFDSENAELPRIFDSLGNYQKRWFCLGS